MRPLFNTKGNRQFLDYCSIIEIYHSTERKISYNHEQFTNNWVRQKKPLFCLSPFFFTTTT